MVVDKLIKHLPYIGVAVDSVCVPADGRSVARLHCQTCAAVDSDADWSKAAGPAVTCQVLLVHLRSSAKTKRQL